MGAQIIGAENMLGIKDAKIVFGINGTVGAGGSTPTEGTKPNGRTGGSLIDDGANTKAITKPNIAITVTASLAVLQLIQTH